MAHGCGCPVALSLSLGAATLDLLDAANGFAIEEIDLGYPNVREDVSPIPDRNGQWDDTLWFGPRVVSVTGTFIPSPSGSRSKAFEALAPFLRPSARPVLTYQIDADVAARFVTLRASALSAPVSNPSVTAFHVAWVASDPVAYSAAVESVTIAPTGFGDGRTYTDPQGAVVTNTSAWVPPRHYPAVTGGLTVNAHNNGDLSTPPVIQITGPATNPAVYNDTAGAVFALGTAAASFSLGTGDVLTIDGRNRTVYLGTDPTNSRYNFVDFARSTWWLLGPGDNQLRYVPQTATPASTAVVAWNDAYL